VSDVICLGILVADLLAKPVDAWPERGRLVLTDRMELHIGGCAANTGIGLARLGVSVGVVGKVGNDSLGEFLESALQKEGVDTRGVVKDAHAPSSSTMVMVHSDGERSLIHCLGANATIHEDDIALDTTAHSRILHVAGSLLMPGFDGIPAAHILHKAKQLGLTTTLDTAWDGSGRWMELVGPMLPFVDYAVPSIEEARMLTGKQSPEEVAAGLMDRGVKTVALKMGINGCYVRSEGVEFTLPAFDIRSIDASGAGDAFAAGFLCGLVKRMDLEQTARLANAVGAMCTLELGTTPGIKTLAETEEFIRTTPVRG
jgi:sugar/nucleoside kinase (ribokinase family)